MSCTALLTCKCITVQTLLHYSRTRSKVHTQTCLLLHHSKLLVLSHIRSTFRGIAPAPAAAPRRP